MKQSGLSQQHPEIKSNVCGLILGEIQLDAKHKYHGKINPNTSLTLKFVANKTQSTMCCCFFIMISKSLLTVARP
jgi:hypothetical protein